MGRAGEGKRLGESGGYGVRWGRVGGQRDSVMRRFTRGGVVRSWFGAGELRGVVGCHSAAVVLPGCGFVMG